MILLTPCRLRVSDAMQDIDVRCHLHHPNPARRLAANNTEDVVSQCHEGIQSGAQPDPHNTIDSSYAMWELLTGGTELRLSSILTFQPNLTAPMRRVPVPR